VIARELKASEASRWDALVAAAPASGFMQSWAWSEFKRVEGYDVLRLGLFDAGVLTGGVSACVYRVPGAPALLAAPDGPVLDWSAPDAGPRLDALVAALRRWPAAGSAVALRVEPRLASCPPALERWARAPVDLVPDETLETPLGPEAEMLARMKPKGRYNARLAERRGVTVELSDEPAFLHDLHFILERTAARQDFLVEPKSFFVNLAAACPPGTLRWARASYKGMTLAAAVTLRFGGTATFLYGGMLPLFPEVMASYALHWALMRDAAAAGLKVYDLYGYAGPDRPGHPYARFSRFKEKLGGVPVRRLGCRDLLFYDRLAEAAVGLIKEARR
jgi:peptidoglycan pentaglycine glycine transferase (the first glycine)